MLAAGRRPRQSVHGQGSWRSYDSTGNSDVGELGKQMSGGSEFGKDDDTAPLPIIEPGGSDMTAPTSEAAELRTPTSAETVIGPTVPVQRPEVIGPTVPVRRPEAPLSKLARRPAQPTGPSPRLSALPPLPPLLATSSTAPHRRITDPSGTPDAAAGRHTWDAPLSKKSAAKWRRGSAPGAPVAEGVPVYLAAAHRMPAIAAVVRRQWKAVIAVAVLVAGVAAVVIVSGGDKDGQSASATADSTHSGAPRNTTLDSDEGTRLLKLMPHGYPSGVCEPVLPTADGVKVQVECGPYPQAGGPSSATYQSVSSPDQLDVLLKAALAEVPVRICPGRIQSPGPWRRNASADRVSGTLYCAQWGDQPVMGWTDTDRGLYVQIRAGRDGASAEQLYRWWSVNV